MPGRAGSAARADARQQAGRAGERAGRESGLGRGFEKRPPGDRLSGRHDQAPFDEGVDVNPTALPAELASCRQSDTARAAVAAWRRYQR